MAFDEKKYRADILKRFKAGFRMDGGLVFMNQVKAQIKEGVVSDKYFSKEQLLAIWDTAWSEKEARLAETAAQKNNKRIKLKEVEQLQGKDQ